MKYLAIRCNFHNSVQSTCLKVANIVFIGIDCDVFKPQGDVNSRLSFYFLLCYDECTMIRN